MPNAVGIFQNRTVAGEVADSGDVVNGFLCPDVFVQIIFFRIMNGLGESFQICQNEVIVAIQQFFVDYFEQQNIVFLAEHIGNPDAVSVVLQREAQVAV